MIYSFWYSDKFQSNFPKKLMFASSAAFRGNKMLWFRHGERWDTEILSLPKCTHYEFSEPSEGGQSVLVAPGAWHSCRSRLYRVSWPPPAFWLPPAGSAGAQAHKAVPRHCVVSLQLNTDLFKWTKDIKAGLQLWKSWLSLLPHENALMKVKPEWRQTPSSGNTLNSIPQ